MHFRTPGVAHHHALGAAWVSNIRHTVVLTFVRDLSDHVHSKPIDVKLRSGFDECMMLWILLGSIFGDTDLLSSLRSHLSFSNQQQVYLFPSS